MKKLKKICHIFFEEYGEWDAFFTPRGKLIDYWHGNDAHWRGEYMAGLMAHTGYEVVSPNETQYTKMSSVFAKELMDAGYIGEEQDIEA